MFSPPTIHAALQHARSAGKKGFAVLIDPDCLRLSQVEKLLSASKRGCPDYFFVGGSLLVDDHLEDTLLFIREHSPVPIVLFPGSPMQISRHADAILLLSLISGRNADLLIGQHIIAAPYLRASGLEILPTGYMLIDGGKPTTASYISNSSPIPADKPEIAVCTAMAGEMLGLKLLYLDTGSGANHAVPEDMIRAVRASVQLPLIAGGGLRRPEQVRTSLEAGADLVVVGSAIEQDPALLQEMVDAVASFGGA